MIIAGIGSRKTPMPMLALAEQVGMLLAVRGHCARSGGAVGFDTAFERGFNAIAPDYFMRFTPMQNSEWFRHAARYHPVWDTLTTTVKALHARNSAIIMGATLDHPVQAVVCWTQGSGGTMQGLRIAESEGIPIFNLADGPVSEFWAWLDKRETAVRGSVR